MQSVIREVFFPSFFLFLNHRKSLLLSTSVVFHGLSGFMVFLSLPVHFFSFNDHTKSLIWPHVILTSFGLMMAHFTDIRAVSGLYFILRVNRNRVQI